MDLPYVLGMAALLALTLLRARLRPPGRQARRPARRRAMPPLYWISGLLAAALLAYLLAALFYPEDFS